MSDKDDKNGDKNVFAKASAEQRAAYRAALDAADSADGNAGYPAEFKNIATRAGALSDSEFQAEKHRVFAHYAREAARKRLEAADKEHSERVIDVA